MSPLIAWLDLTVCRVLVVWLSGKVAIGGGRRWLLVKCVSSLCTLCVSSVVLVDRKDRP